LSGVALAGFQHFWIGLYLWTAAAIYLPIGWIYTMRDRNRWVRFGVAAALLLCLLCVPGWLLVLAAPLGIEIAVLGSEYPANAIIGGITWQPDFGDVRISLSNRTDRDYEDLDLTFDAGDANVMAMAQVTSIPNFSVFATIETPKPHVILGGADRQGRSVRMPIIASGPQPSPWYRIRLSNLPRHTTLEIVAALAIFNQPEGGECCPDKLFAPFHRPIGLRLYGSYKSLKKPFEIDWPAPNDQSVK
jgi:hypothetical protein